MRHRFLAVCLVASLMVGVFGIDDALAVAPGNEYFQQTWARTDQPIVDGQISRTWMWGPEAFTGVVNEPYAESPGGTRAVQYFDKARMEITNPSADPTSIWYVTNGLLVVELISGRLQTGDATFETHAPAQVNVAGDSNDPNGPTYGTFAGVLDQSPLPVGTTITQRINRAGDVSEDSSLTAQAISVAIVDDVTNHSIAGPFWELMNSVGVVYQGGSYDEDLLFENPYFATGRPITEPYWADVLVAGQSRLVLMQCFERRCLTYTPGNSPGFVTEAGNVGQHYYTWRYESIGQPNPEPAPPAPEPPTPEPPSDKSMFGDGTWIVGVDIQPGTYRNSDSSDVCYWARLSGTGGTLDEIIANDISSARQIVEIQSSDYAFESNRCGIWSTDLTPITSSPTASFSDGTYFVGEEVSPGIWRNSDSSEGCYWERKSGFGGTLDEVVSNGFADIRQVVEISASDVGFETSDCGTWTLNPGPITTSQTADFGDGTYIVGVDIQAGQWVTDSSPEGCYWERVAAFSGSITDINDNEFVSEESASPQQVTISSTDAGFSTSGCGTWHFLGS